MSPTTRKFARLVGELGSTYRRLKNLVPEIREIEKKSGIVEQKTSDVVERLTS
jgi:hypothetical protein